MDNIKVLKNFIEKVDNVKKDDYIESTFTKFEEVLKNSKELLNDTDKKANKQYVDLVTAYLDLRLKPNKDLLKKTGD